MVLSSQAVQAQIDMHSHMIPDSYLEAVYMKPVDVDANISHLYYDLAGAATDAAIESLLTITEPSHILYGSDYPYVAAPSLIAAKKALEDRFAAHGLIPEDILTNNAKTLFNIQ